MSNPDSLVLFAWTYYLSTNSNFDWSTGFSRD